MRFSVPITITKAGDPVTPHLVSVHLGGSSNVDVLGMMKEDGTILLFQQEGSAVVANQNGSVSCWFDIEGETVMFGELSEEAFEEFQDQYNWIAVGTSLSSYGYDGTNICTVSIFDDSEEVFNLVLYDFVVMSSGETLDLPISMFIERLEIDPDSAFITSCEVDGVNYLALSINGIVRPICDLAGNMGSEMTENGATFSVPDCSNVRAGGQGIVNLPAQIAITQVWSARSCSVDQGNVTTYLKASVTMLDWEWLVLTPEITKPAGDWYIPISDFSVGEA